MSEEENDLREYLRSFDDVVDVTVTELNAAKLMIYGMAPELLEALQSMLDAPTNQASQAYADCWLAANEVAKRARGEVSSDE